MCRPSMLELHPLFQHSIRSKEGLMHLQLILLDWHARTTEKTSVAPYIHSAESNSFIPELLEMHQMD